MVYYNNAPAHVSKLPKEQNIDESDNISCFNVLTRQRQSIARILKNQKTNTLYTRFITEKIENS